MVWLNGQPLNGDILIEIAKIADQDWQKGAAHVLPMIVEIE